MNMKTLAALAFFLAAGAAHAQAPAPAPSAKKELVARILKLQQSGIETVARNLAEQPAMAMLERATPVLQARIPPERREAVAAEIRGDIRKYLDEAVPLVRERAVKLAPSTVGAMLEEKFSEEELKQVLAMIESPVYAKFQQMGEEMQKALVDKVVSETRGAIAPKVQALDNAMARRLGLPGTAPAAPASAPRPPAKPASK